MSDIRAQSTSEAFDLLYEAVDHIPGFVVEPDRKHFEVRASSDATKFVLTFMPGNRRVLISHGVEVFPGFRGKGLGTSMCEMREQVARLAGVTLLLATVRDENLAEVRVLEKCGWKRLTQNEENKCSLWGKQLL